VPGVKVELKNEKEKPEQSGGAPAPQGKMQAGTEEKTKVRK